MCVKGFTLSCVYTTKSRNVFLGSVPTPVWNESHSSISFLVTSACKVQTGIV